MTTEKHYKIHRFLKYDQKNMVYRTTVKIGAIYKGYLLDNKMVSQLYYDCIIKDF